MPSAALQFVPPRYSVSRRWNVNSMTFCMYFSPLFTIAAGSPTPANIAMRRAKPGKFCQGQCTKERKEGIGWKDSLQGHAKEGILIFGNSTK
eukprot:365314-Chlamydomonas_euryale.AAC.9